MTYPVGTNILYTYSTKPHQATVVASGPKLLLAVFRKPPGTIPRGTFNIIRLELEAERVALDPDTSPNPAAKDYL